MKVRLGEYFSGITNGVAQGSTLAPYLFSIYTKALIGKLKGLGVWFRLYADDIVVLVDNRRKAA